MNPNEPNVQSPQHWQPQTTPNTQSSDMANQSQQPTTPQPGSIPPVATTRDTYYQPVLQQPQASQSQQYPQNDPNDTSTPVNSYDFIVNTPTPLKKPMLSGSSQPKKLLLIVSAGGFFVLLLSVIAAMFLKPNDSRQEILSVAQQQQEVIRVAEKGKQATSEDLKNLAYTIDLSVNTSKSELLGYASKKGVTLTEEELALKQDATTDKTLENAKATSTIDSALRNILAQELQTYLTDLQQAHQTTKSQGLKQVLSKNYEAGKTLLTQARSDSDDSQP